MKIEKGARKFIQTLLECTNNPVFPWKIKVKVLISNHFQSDFCKSIKSICIF